MSVELLLDTWRSMFCARATKYRGGVASKTSVDRWAMYFGDKRIARLEWAPNGTPVQITLRDNDLPATVKFNQSLKKIDIDRGMDFFYVPSLDITPGHQVLHMKEEMKSLAVALGRSRDTSMRHLTMTRIRSQSLRLYEYCRVYQLPYPDDVPEPGDTLGGYLSSILPPKALARLVQEALA
jgi:hypothetical protein